MCVAQAVTCKEAGGTQGHQDLFSFFFGFAVLELEPRASHTVGKCYPELHTSLGLSFLWLEQ